MKPRSALSQPALDKNVVVSPFSCALVLALCVDLLVLYMVSLLAKYSFTPSAFKFASA